MTVEADIQEAQWVWNRLKIPLLKRNDAQASGSTLDSHQKVSRTSQLSQTGAIDDPGDNLSKVADRTEFTAQIDGWEARVWKSELIHQQELMQTYRGNVTTPPVSVTVTAATENRPGQRRGRKWLPFVSDPLTSAVFDVIKSAESRLVSIRGHSGGGPG